MQQRHQQDRDAAGCRYQHAAADRAVEPEARRQSGREHAGAEYDHHRAGKEQAELDRLELQPLDQNAWGRRKHREQPAHDQADGGCRHQEAAIGNEAEIISGDGRRIERDPCRAMGFAEHQIVGDGACCGENADKGKFGAPAQKVVEGAAKQRRKAGCRRHRDHDQRHRARQRGTAEEIAGNGA